MRGGGGDKRFFADAMLGRLATWMRALGYDVLYERDIPDGELLRRSIEEGRVILTRDTLLVRRRAACGRSFFVTCDRVRDQVREVARRFPPDPGLFLTRCLRCNAPLAEAPKEDVRGRVPPYVFETQEAFRRCPRCRRVYWAGTHRDRMLDELGGIMKEYGGAGG
ncbi:MAG: Mut7-C RNAse domain-containing protein [Thermodesulfobacteriota bacterium]